MSFLEESHFKKWGISSPHSLSIVDHLRRRKYLYCVQPFKQWVLVLESPEISFQQHQLEGSEKSGVYSVNDKEAGEGNSLREL